MVLVKSEKVLLKLLLHDQIAFLYLEIFSHSKERERKNQLFPLYIIMDINSLKLKQCVVQRT